MNSLLRNPLESLLCDFFINVKGIVCQLEEDMKVLDAELQSFRSSLGREQKRAEVAEKSVETLTSSLGESHIALNTANASLDYWCVEWKKLGAEAMEMCQETLETVLDQRGILGHHLDTRWDPKGRRIYNPKEVSGEDSLMVDEPSQPGLDQQVDA
ncbi:hypothetical protein PIB30_028113, partial [Stylosanthes scabra]|nr:hypothetical protein [Stylosanthes scabra]